MLKVFIKRYQVGMRSPNYGWSNVREAIVIYRMPTYFQVSVDAECCELHFDINLSHVAISMLQDIDNAVRSFEFAYIDHFSLE